MLRLKGEVWSEVEDLGNFLSFVCFNVNGGKNRRIIKIVITNAMRRRRM